MLVVRRIALVMGSLYLIYVAKSAIGIDLSKRYHAIDLIRVPVKVLMQELQLSQHQN
mgnify:CR=1 FL=1